MTKRLLVTVAGWEERFLKGCEQDVLTFKPDHLLILFSQEYSEWTSQNRLSLIDFCNNNDVKVTEELLSFTDQVKSFQSLVDLLEKSIDDPDTVVRFNATTSPRDIIWSVLHVLDAKSIRASFSYYRALSYGDWISRDAGVPRLVIKRSGIMYPDLQTCLLVLSGYDDHRLGQLIRKFEPRKVLVGKQTGDQLGNVERNNPQNNDFGINIETFPLDCFDGSLQSVEDILEKIKPIGENYNIIATTLGPKPSALTLFRLTKINPNVGLVYIPAKEYNQYYSQGIDLAKTTIADI